MATRQVTQYVDDLDGAELNGEGRTVRFSYDGRNYEIDLGRDNEQKLADALAPFIEAARPVRVGSSSSRTVGRRASGGKSDLDLGDVRKWARDNGLQVNDRGRVSAQILDAYRTAH